jgi:hypothetical protein
MAEHRKCLKVTWVNLISLDHEQWIELDRWTALGHPSSWVTNYETKSQRPLHTFENCGPRSQ